MTVRFIWGLTSQPNNSKVIKSPSTLVPHYTRHNSVPIPHIHNPSTPRAHTPTAIVIQSDLTVLSEAKVDFDADFGPQYGLTKGVLVNEAEGEVFAPVAMWLEALDLVLSRLVDKKAPLHRVRGVSGACQQHGSVFWGHEAEKLLGAMNGDATKGGLKKQLEGALSYPYGPNWQDHSTQKQCDGFDAALGSNVRLAEVTGSAAHHVSSFPSHPTSPN